MPRTTSQEFQDAAAATKQLTEKPTADDLLAVYGLYKQATQDPPFESAPTPGMFDLKGKAKKNAWKKVVDAGTTPDEAEKKYIELVEGLKTTYKYDANKAPETVGGN